MTSESFENHHHGGSEDARVVSFRACWVPVQFKIQISRVHGSPSTLHDDRRWRGPCGLISCHETTQLCRYLLHSRGCRRSPPDTREETTEIAEKPTTTVHCHRRGFVLGGFASRSLSLVVEPTRYKSATTRLDCQHDQCYSNSPSSPSH